MKVFRTIAAMMAALGIGAVATVEANAADLENTI